MATYVWKDGSLTVTLDDTEGSPADLVFNPADVNEQTRKAAECFGFQTALRNATAGKMDDLDEARKLLLGRAKVFMTVGWKSESDGKAKVELTNAEQAEVIGDLIVRVKQQNGDKRKPNEILKAFNGLDDAKKATVLADLKKPIDKALKQKLKEKKDAAKVKSEAVAGF